MDYYELERLEANNAQRNDRLNNLFNQDPRLGDIGNGYQAQLQQASAAYGPNREGFAVAEQQIQMNAFGQVRDRYSQIGAPAEIAGLEFLGEGLAVGVGLAFLGHRVGREIWEHDHFHREEYRHEEFRHELHREEFHGQEFHGQDFHGQEFHGDARIDRGHEVIIGGDRGFAGVDRHLEAAHGINQAVVRPEIRDVHVMPAHVEQHQQHTEEHGGGGRHH